jgi:hypothetical protein
MGSTRIARRAGSHPTSNAALSSSNGTDRNTTGSSHPDRASVNRPGSLSSSMSLRQSGNKRVYLAQYVRFIGPVDNVACMW